MKQKKSPTYNTKVKTKSDKQFFFALFSDDFGVYVKTVNRGLKDKKVNPDYFSGTLRDAAVLFNLKKTETKLIVDWNNPYSHIYLDRHPDLLEILTKVDNLINQDGKAIYSGSMDNPVVLNIIDSVDVLLCSVTLCDNQISRVISDRYSLVGNRILSTLPLGAGYKSLLDLNSTILKSEVNQFLSIVYSNFINIELKYSGFKIERTGECELLPSLIIENVDDSGFMTINTSFSFKDLITPEFYHSYRPSKLLFTNYDNRTITISELTLPEIDVLDSLIKMLYYIEVKYELTDSFNIEENGVIVHPDMAHVMFSSELKSILDNFSLFGEKFLKKNRLKKSKPNLELLLSSAVDFLQGSAHLKIYGESLPLYQAVSTFNKKGYIPLKDGDKGIIDKSYIDKIKKVIREGKNGIEVSFFDLPYIENELEAGVKGAEFVEKILNYKKTKDQLDNIQLDLSGLNGTLRPYQEDGVKWMKNLHSVGVAGCLSDDMGLGKTVQTITFLLQVFKSKPKEPTLIVMPKSLIFNWINEFKKFAPELIVGVYYGGARDMHTFNKNQIILTTYHTLRNDIDKIKEITFFYTILDELQNIKNHTSGLAKACFLLKSNFRLGMSGTPIENSLGDLFSICRYLNPTLFGSFRRFKDEWSGPITSEDSEIVTNILRSKIKPLFLRRIKEDVLDDLPAKSEQVLYVDMSEKQKSYYETVRKDYHDKICLQIRDEGIDKSQLTIIKAFMELRQIATIPEVKSKGSIISPKKELILEQLLETVEGGHKVLVFSNFLAAIKGLSDSLVESGVGHRVITGATNKREKIVEEFMDDPEVKVLIMTLKTGGVGLNLTVASYVYIMDPWWNLASENQAIDRTHRIGQKNAVFCYRFIARGTIEEKILDLHSRKKELFDNLFSKNKKVTTGFDSEDIDYLLG
ncbi:MAG: DEAD/DEAH box helicase [Spirochaetaceae bacterium]